MLDEIQHEFLQEERKERRQDLRVSSRVAANTKSEGKKELLQYRMFDNDSDGDVIEGLGNTTLDIKQNISAADNYDDNGQGSSNRQS